MKKTRTVADIARYAEVSPATVSKALNGRDDISEATRGRILAVAKRLNYPFRRHHRVQPRRRTVGRIGLICFGTAAEALFRQYPYAKLIHAVEQEVAAEGDHLLVEFGVQGVPRCFQSGGIDGAIGLGVLGDPTELRAVKDVPIVFALDAPAATGFDCVCQDSRDGTELATRMLIERGHRRIGFLSHTAERRVFQERASGYALAMYAHGLPASFRTSPEHSTQCQQEFAEHVVREGWTATVAVNDNLACGLLGCLASMGVRVPQDVSVVGFDNWPQEQLWPGMPLATVDGNVEEAGRQAVQLLRRRIDGQDGPPVRITVPPRLVMGSSVGPPSEGRGS